MKTPKIFIVDDEMSVRTSLEEWFLEDGFAVTTAENAEEALRRMNDGPFDIILLDLKMPGMDGIELQQRILEIYPDAIVVIMTAYATIDTAVKALKQGAFDYITKPFDPDDLSRLIQNALRQKDLELENVQLKEKISELSAGNDIIGSSDQMKNVFELVNTVAETDSTVLIRGESGTGKELIAKAIHSQSSRKYLPIISVNCGAIPETLLESELFGHEKGAFTGAQYRRKGKFEMADGGTLFLDEIGDITPRMQVDLLRVLENRKFTRLGGSEERESDFRLICATNRNLEKLVEEEKFREDLYYRINVFSIFVPPLKKRAADIIPLAEYFVEKYARTMGKHVLKISPAVQKMLLSYSWPGNVRELENAIERAMVVGKKTEIQIEDLPLLINGEKKTRSNGLTLAEIEKQHIQQVLSEAAGNITRAAGLLGIDRVTLYSKLKKHGISR